jgi:hypothetical protein
VESQPVWRREAEAEGREKKQRKNKNASVERKVAKQCTGRDEVVGRK